MLDSHESKKKTLVFPRDEKRVDACGKRHGRHSGWHAATIAFFHSHLLHPSAPLPLPLSMPDLNGVRVTIFCNDQPLEEYEATYEGDTVTCWIPSEVGKVRAHESP